MKSMDVRALTTTFHVDKFSRMKPILFSIRWWCQLIIFTQKYWNLVHYIVNHNLLYINMWFQANKLSLNVSKTKYTYFHKLTKADEMILLKLPNLSIIDIGIKRESVMKFLWVSMDGNISWRSHIQFKLKFPKI